MICHPYFVSIGFEILFFLSNSNAAFSNGIELICPLENGFNLPPLKDEFLYGSSWCNNICLYFSNSCHFCLVMNLYLSLAIKRAKFRALKTKFDKEQKNKEEPLEYVCCHCKGVDSMLEWCGYKKEDEENQNVVYFCCDC